MKPLPPRHALPGPGEQHLGSHHHVREAERILRRNLAIASLVVLGSLFAGAAGYHWLGDLPWLDAALNAAMILTGMGPLDKPASSGGKVFAIVYALFAGVVFLSVVALLLLPLFHRALHKFHLEAGKD